jgi:predicted hotdog family 3-hydroxylacyl-ACP dehydratase
MCLLEEVLEWDAQRIVCRSGSHRAVDHPLRSGERLGIACAIEYAAQAIALHGVLCTPTSALTGAADSTPRSGYLASVRDVRFGAVRIDDIAADLLCTATRLAGDAGTVLYEFGIAADGDPRHQAHWLIAGRATIALQEVAP